MGDRVLGFADIGSCSALLGDGIYVGYDGSGVLSFSDNNNDQDRGMTFVDSRNESSCTIP